MIPSDIVKLSEFITFYLIPRLIFLFESSLMRNRMLYHHINRMILNVPLQMKFFLVFIFILFDNNQLHHTNITTVTALDAPRWVMQQKFLRYQRNGECMRRKRWELQNYGIQPYRAVVAIENSTIWLPCFECLHPDDAEELEDIWKPSPSVIGRKIHKFLKMIKEKIARARKGKKRRQKQSELKRNANGELFLAEYRWEHLVFDDDDRNLERGKWVPATHGFDEKGRNNQTTVMNFIDEVMSKGSAADDAEGEQRKDKKERKRKNKWKKSMFIGDHMELEIRRLNESQHRGWYRCVQRHDKFTGNVAAPKPLNISQIYLLDVLQQQDVVMRQVSNDQLYANLAETNTAEFAAADMSIPFGEQLGLEVYWHASEWTSCNKCGNRTGERRRTLSCHVRLKPLLYPLLTELQSEYPELQVFLAFLDLPCASSLLPVAVRYALPKNFSMIYEEFAECQSTCISRLETRNVTALEESADTSDKSLQLFDVLPPGEYTSQERLPPLPPPIMRSTIFANEDQRLQLDCSNQDGLALIWRKNFEELNASGILAADRAKWIWDERQRVQLTARGQLLIESIRRDDAGLYSCTTFPGGHILRTFRIYFVPSDRTRHLFEWIPLILRALLLIYVILLLIDLLSVDLPNI